VVRLVEERLNVRLVAWQKLYTSFVYLRKLMELLETPPPELPVRLTMIGWLPQRCVGLVQRTLYVGTRILDRWLGTDLSVYGWAFFFERLPAEAVADPIVEQPGFVNVCLYCGTGQPAASAPRTGRWSCRCQNCSRTYPYFRAFRNAV
jgi:hypothetical protein